jgi:hypothetical protein
MAFAVSGIGVKYVKANADGFGPRVSGPKTACEVFVTDDLFRHY